MNTNQLTLVRNPGLPQDHPEMSRVEYSLSMMMDYYNFSTCRAMPALLGEHDFGYGDSAPLLLLIMNEKGHSYMALGFLRVAVETEWNQCEYGEKFWFTFSGPNEEDEEIPEGYKVVAWADWPRDFQMC